MGPPQLWLRGTPSAHQALRYLVLSPHESNTMPQVVGTFLYYAYPVYPNMLVALNIISVEQVTSTQTTAKALTHILIHTATHSEAIT